MKKRLKVHDVDVLKKALTLEAPVASDGTGSPAGFAMVSPAGFAMVSPAGFAMVSPAGFAMASPAGFAII